MIKLLYKPVGMLVSVLGGVLAGWIFKRVWKIAAREDDAPQATDAQRGWREVLLAAALQGAIFAAVKAAVDRGAAAEHAQAHRRLARRRRPAGRQGSEPWLSQIAGTARAAPAVGQEPRRSRRRTRSPAARTRRWNSARPAGEESAAALVP